MAFQLKELDGHLALLPSEGPRRHPGQRLVLKLLTAVRLAEVDELCAMDAEGRMPALDGLAPASHGELELDGCKVPATARLGDMADAYPAMALPFRDVEDTVGTANIGGMLSWLLERSAARIEQSEDNALRLGRIAGLVSLVHAASRLAVASLDGEGPDDLAR